MGGVKLFDVYKKDLYTNVNNKLYWVFEIYK